VFVCFSDPVAAFYMDTDDARMTIIQGPNMTAEEARQYLEARNGGPMDGAIVDLILNTLGTRVIDLMNMHRELESKMNDTKQVEMYLRTKIGHAEIRIGIAIASHPKMLDLFMELDKRNELSTAQVMRILGVNGATLESIESLLAKTGLVLIDPEANMLTFNGTLVRNGFTEWKKKEKENRSSFGFVG
jgi:hypothetical protein